MREGSTGYSKALVMGESKYLVTEYLLLITKYSVVGTDYLVLVTEYLVVGTD